MDRLTHATLAEFNEAYPYFWRSQLRTDIATDTASVIDVIRLVIPLDASCASKHVKKASHTAGPIQHRKINGTGRSTPCANAHTLTEIIWGLPGRAALEYRYQLAYYISLLLDADKDVFVDIWNRYLAEKDYSVLKQTSIEH